MHKRALHDSFFLLFQGRFEESKKNVRVMEENLDELFRTSMESVSDSLEKATLVKLWSGDISVKDAKLPPSHVALTLSALKRAMLCYSSRVYTHVTLSSTVDGGETTTSVVAHPVKSVSRMLSDSAIVSSDRSAVANANLGRSQSLVTNKVEIRLNDELLVSAQSSPVRSVPSNVSAAVEPESSRVPINHNLDTVNHSPGSNNQNPGSNDQNSCFKDSGKSGAATKSSSATDFSEHKKLFKEIVSDLCMEGGWGVCASSCVVGGILGVLGGYDALPTDWLNKFPHNNKRYLGAKVNLLLDLFGLP